MADKQALNATFFAFQKRERGGVLLGASITYAVLSIILFGGFIALNMGAIGDYMTWTMSMGQQAATAPDPNNPFAGAMPPPSVMALGGWYTLLSVVIYLLLAAYEAACLRWMVRGETKGLFGLALDGDTWRVYFTYWVWFFLAIAVYIVMAILFAGVIAGVVMGGAAQSAQNDQAAIASLGFGFFGAGLLVCILLIYFAVRFAPAAATSVAKRRFAFFDAWTVTKGRFWALFGAFILLWLMCFVAICIFYGALFVMIGAPIVSQMAAGGGPPNEQEALAMFGSPSVWAPALVLYLLMVVGGFVFWVSFFGINARAAQAALEEGKITAAPV